MIRTICTLIGVLGLALGVLGCGTRGHVNPSLPATMSEAKDILEEMEDDPKPGPRPVVVLGGYLDVGINRVQLDRRLRRVLGEDAELIGLSFPLSLNFDTCRRRVIKQVEAAFPSDDPTQTVEVDVVAFSMGGVIARYAAMPPAEGDDDALPRLRIARLFTIATPHRGATLAQFPNFDPRVRDMKAGSAFLAQLDAHAEQSPYPIYPYVRLGDPIVGAENAAPGEEHAWWVDPPLVTANHIQALVDPRIVADIALRLRGEQPLATLPRAPLP